jgi:hypothetical protein
VMMRGVKKCLNMSTPVENPPFADPKFPSLLKTSTRSVPTAWIYVARGRPDASLNRCTGQ